GLIFGCTSSMYRAYASWAALSSVKHVIVMYRSASDSPHAASSSLRSSSHRSRSAGDATGRASSALSSGSMLGHAEASRRAGTNSLTAWGMGYAVALRLDFGRDHRDEKTPRRVAGRLFFRLFACSFGRASPLPHQVLELLLAIGDPLVPLRGEPAEG